jgi:hypothetical protein
MKQKPLLTYYGINKHVTMFIKSFNAVITEAPNVLGHQNNNPPHPGCDDLSRIQVFLG